jgi:hypothetical protein
MRGGRTGSAGVSALGQDGYMKYVAIIRRTETSEIEAEGEALALARIELEAKLPEGFQILAIRQGRPTRRALAAPASPAAR